MPTLSVSPTTVTQGQNVTISWSGFRDGLTIILESVSGPGTISSIIGNTSSGSITSPALIDVGVWVLRARQPSPQGDLYSNTVALTVIAEAPPPEIPWWLILGGISIVTIIGGVIYLATRK